MKIGLIKSMDYSPCCPANKRAVELVAENLKKMGHEIVEIKLPNERELSQIFIKVFTADLMEPLYNQLDGEPLINQYRNQEIASQMGSITKFIVGGILRVFLG